MGVASPLLLRISRWTELAVNQESPLRQEAGEVEESPLGQEAGEIEELTQIVADSLAKGEEPHTIVQQLIDSGWEPEQANAFVGSIYQHIHAANQKSSGGSKSQGWLIWIGAIVAIKLLSWLFN